VIRLIVVTVLLHGVPVAAAHPAYLNADDVVVAPLVPVVSDIADAIDVDRGAIRIRRGPRGIALLVGRDAYQSQGTVYVPLARVVRALGGSVSYDSVRKVAAIDMPEPQVVSTPTPFDAGVPNAPPTSVFTAQPTVTARPTPSGIPRPRRTPIPVTPSGP